MAKNELVVSRESKFEGGLLSLWGTRILQFLVFGIFVAVGAFVATLKIVGNSTPLVEDLKSLTTLAFLFIGFVIAALGFCWACIIGIKWEVKNCVIKGQRLKFKAGFINLFFNCVKWTILTIITIGIYGLWMPIKVRAWVVKNIDAYVEEDEYGYAAPEITYYEYDDEEEFDD